jgi:hypothetical protein
VAEDAVEEQEEWLGAAIPAAAARAGSGQKKTPGPGKERIDSVSAVAETWRARRAECVGAGGAAGSAGRREAVRPEQEQAALETKELGRIAMVERGAQRRMNNRLLPILYGLSCVYAMYPDVFTRGALSQWQRPPPSPPHPPSLQTKRVRCGACAMGEAEVRHRTAACAPIRTRFRFQYARTHTGHISPLYVTA